jgi:chemotaxis protein MotB
MPASEPVQPLQPLPRRRLRQRAAEHVNHERWVVSYADFVTLLFAFFTMLYASSNVDAKKLRATVDSMQNAFDRGGTWYSRTGATKPGGATKAANDGHQPGVPSLPDLQSRLAQALKSPIDQKLVDLTVDRRGLVISIREGGAFGAGSSDISEQGQAVMREIANGLALVDNPVRVEGHTDDVPIHTAKFASNWELSTARATRVVALLLENTGIRPERISASGYGEFHPRVPNTPAGRSQNRRVDLVILNAATQAAEEAVPVKQP